MIQFDLAKLPATDCKLQVNKAITPTMPTRLAPILGAAAIVPKKNDVPLSAKRWVARGLAWTPYVRWYGSGAALNRP